MTIPLVVLLGLLAFGLVKWGKQKVSGVLVGIVFGLALATTAVGPPILNAVSDCVGVGRRGDLVGGAVMDSGREALLSEKRMVCAGLREWPAALYGPDAAFTSAAVELVIAAFDGSLADPGWPWVRESDMFGVFWLDPDPMPDFDGAGGELRLLPVVEALLGGRRVPDLVQLLRRAWTRSTLDLVLAAFADASDGQRELALYAFGGDPEAAANGLRDATQPRRRPWSTTSPDGWRRDRRSTTDRRPGRRRHHLDHGGGVAVGGAGAAGPGAKQRAGRGAHRAAAGRRSGRRGSSGVAAAGGAAAGAAGVGEVVAGVRRRRLLVAAPCRACGGVPHDPAAAVLAAAGRPGTGRPGPPGRAVVALVQRPGRPRGPVGDEDPGQ